MNIDELLKELFDASYVDNGWTYKCIKETSSARIIIKNIITKYVYNSKEYQLEKENAILKAKLFIYENIISNSNFKAVLSNVALEKYVYEMPKE